MRIIGSAAAIAVLAATTAMAASQSTQPERRPNAAGTPEITGSVSEAATPAGPHFIPMPSDLPTGPLLAVPLEAGHGTSVPPAYDRVDVEGIRMLERMR